MLLSRTAEASKSESTIERRRAAILRLLVLLVRKRAEANVAVCLSQVRNRLNYFGY